MAQTNMYMTNLIRFIRDGFKNMQKFDNSNMSPIGQTKIPVNEINKTSSYCKPIVIAGRVTCIYNMFASKQCE